MSRDLVPRAAAPKPPESESPRSRSPGSKSPASQSPISTSPTSASADPPDNPDEPPAWAVGLNPEQYRAAAHRGSPLLIVAGAGTGKTRTLVARVTRLIEDGADPDRILLLTFTRRAAAEMVGRVVSACPGRKANQIWGGTFHSVANRLLRRYGSAAGLPDGFTVLDHSDATDLFGLVRTEEGFGQRGRRFPRAETIAAIYSRMVNSQAKLADVLQVDFPWCAEHLEDLRTLCTGYTEMKRRNQVLDYDDLLLFWRGLTASPVGEALRCLFDHILIDEYQDTNPIQADIVGGMNGPDTEVCAVGDDAQAIYGFRAATVANMWTFPDTYPDTRIVVLEQNYRSSMPILRVANAVLAQHTDPDQAVGHPQNPGVGRPEDGNPAGLDASPTDTTAGQRSLLDREQPPAAGFRKELWSTTADGTKPMLLSCGEEGEQSRLVADRILDARERGIDLREQAVLFRAGHHADGLELELVRRDIPYVKYGGLKYLETAHVKDLLALLRVLENPEDQLAWHRVLRSMEGVGPATVRRLSDELRITKPNANALDRFIDGIGRVPSAASEQATELRSALGDCLAGDIDPATQIDRLKQFCVLVFPNRYDNSDARLADIDQLAAGARGYTSRSRFLTELTLDPPSKTGDLAGPPHLDDDWLTLSTIHSAKGCEWKSVYLLHAADGNIPSEMALGDSRGLAEELRLLYVAVTRAKAELTVSFPLRFHVNRFNTDDRHVYAQLSRFIDPIRNLFDETVTAPADAEPELSFGNVGVADEVDAMLTSLWS
ncbi:MAG: ATP-dependent helicase [Actinomycetota bacterium]